LVPGTKLRVLEHLASDSGGNQRVLVRCEWFVNGRRCDTEKPMRATDMTRQPYEDRNGKPRLPHRSCGCQSKLANQIYWENRAKGFPRRTQQDVYRGMVSGHQSPEQLAKRFKLPINLITTIFRVYAENPRQRRERAPRRRRRRAR
jgi:hypothetical protein